MRAERATGNKKPGFGPWAGATRFVNRWPTLFGARVIV